MIHVLVTAALIVTKGDAVKAHALLSGPPGK